MLSSALVSYWISFVEGRCDQVALGVEEVALTEISKFLFLLSTFSHPGIKNRRLRVNFKPRCIIETTVIFVFQHRR